MDKLYLDRTFNGQDWFALRQAALKKKYKSTQDVYDAIKVSTEFRHRVSGVVAGSSRRSTQEHAGRVRRHQR